MQGRVYVDVLLLLTPLLPVSPLVFFNGVVIYESSMFVPEG